MYRQPRSRQPVYPGTIPAVQLPVQYLTELDTPAMVPASAAGAGRRGAATGRVGVRGCFSG